MLNKSKMVGSLAGLGFFLFLTPTIGLAEMTVSAEKQTSQFQKIEQPFGLKLAVALGGLGLIGAELWWFMFSKTKSQKASVEQSLQEKDNNE